MFWSNISTNDILSIPKDDVTDCPRRIRKAYSHRFPNFIPLRNPRYGFPSVANSSRSSTLRDCVTSFISFFPMPEWRHFNARE